jgi:hypothetical protein
VLNDEGKCPNGFCVSHFPKFNDGFCEHDNGVECIEALKQFLDPTMKFGDTLPPTVDVPPFDHHVGADSVTAVTTWGEWVEAQIYRAIRAAERAECGGYSDIFQHDLCAVIVIDGTMGGGGYYWDAQERLAFAGLVPSHGRDRFHRYYTRVSRLASCG